MINHELQIRGKPFLETCSRNMVLNRSQNQIKISHGFKKFRKQKEEIAFLKHYWSSKMKELEIKDFTANEALNLTHENKKLSDLSVLKEQEIPGPFTSSNEIQSFMNSFPDSKEKNKCLYLEVRYERESSLSLKRTAAVFKLKSGVKILQQNIMLQTYAITLTVQNLAVQ